MSTTSIAWCPSTAGDNLDDLCIVTTNSNGAIIVYSAIVPDPFVSSQWISEQISQPGAASVEEAPAIAFGSSVSTHIAASSPNGDGVVYYLRRRLGLLFSGWMSQNVSGATGSVVGVTVMPDDQVYILTVSSGGQLIGWLGTFNNPFVQLPIPNATNPTLAIGAAMTVRSVSSSQVEVHVVALQQGTPVQLTYFWSTYEAGSGGGAGSFGTWQPNQIPIPQSSVHLGAPSIALSHDGSVIVTSRAGSPPLLYCFTANSPGSTWNPPVSFAAIPGNSSNTVPVAVDASGATHSFCITRSPDPEKFGYQPSVVDVTLAPGETIAGQIIIDNPPDPETDSPGVDPLNWDSLTWSAKGYLLPNQPMGTQPTQNWGFGIVPGMTVRASGEVDVAFFNFPYLSVALFTLPLSANAWNYNFVGFPDQQ